MSELKRNKIILVCSPDVKEEAMIMAREHLTKLGIEGELICADDIEKVPLEERQSMLPKFESLPIKNFSLPAFVETPIIEPEQPKHKQKQFTRQMQNFHRGFNPKKR